MALATVTVTATYGFPDAPGIIPSGVVVFTPSATLQDGPDGQILTPRPVVATLDDTGSISQSLIATDAAGISPSGWVWIVQELVSGSTRVPYPILLPQASSPVNLATIAPAIPQPALVSYVSLSAVAAANGVASLDSGGQVPANQLGHAGGGGAFVDAAAARLGYAAITFAPELATQNGGAGLSAGTFVTDEIYLGGVPITKLGCWLVTEGITPSGFNGMSLFTSAGVLVASTGDMSALFATSGADLIIEGTLTGSPITPAAGRYIVSALCHFSGSSPHIAATGGLPNTPPENGISPGGFLTGQATPPASFNPATLNQNNGGYWFTAR